MHISLIWVFFCLFILCPCSATFGVLFFRNAHIHCLHAMILGSLYMLCMFILILLHRPLLINVILHAKVSKAEKYIPDVPPGFEPLVPKPGITPFNSRLQKPLLRGRDEEALELLRTTKGKRPRTGHMPRPALSCRFYT